MAKTASRKTRVRRTGAEGGLATVVYDRLRETIVTLKLAPGAPVTELDLCKRLGVSRTPVRAALQRLQQEGLVVASRSGSIGRAVVAPLTADDMRELFLIVGALDGVAARLAAELPEESRLALIEDIERVNTRLREMANGSEIADIRQVQELDLQFHRAYERAAGPRLLGKLNALHARRERYVRVYTEALIHNSSLLESICEHDAVIAAIRAGDGDAAERAAAFNYRNALGRYKRIVAILGERGSWY